MNEASRVIDDPKKMSNDTEEMDKETELARLKEELRQSQLRVRSAQKRIRLLERGDERRANEFVAKRRRMPRSEKEIVQSTLVPSNNTSDDVDVSTPSPQKLSYIKRSHPQLVPTIFSLNSPRSTRRPRLDRFASLQTKMVINQLPQMETHDDNERINRVLSNIDGAIKKTPSAEAAAKTKEGDEDDAEDIIPIASETGKNEYFSSAQFMQDIVSMSKTVEAIFEREQRLLTLSSPVHVFGDIHGNEDDLRYFSEKIWPRGLCLTPGRFLFLGDYVDRGLNGLEVVAYLFAYKILFPEKVFMLRGNHETRAVNGWEQYYGSGSLLVQCKSRFGDRGGRVLWEQINCAFDVMPLAAIVDSSLFCVHGGIPRPLHAEGLASNDTSSPFDNVTNDQRLDEIRSMPIRLGVRPPLEHETEAVNRMAVDLLWSDPAKARQEGSLGEDGFGEGLRGPDAVCYGEKAVDDFLKRFGLSYIVRAHEPTYSGITVSKSARVLTVFSTSKDHGCGDGASCGCILVDNDFIYAINKSGKSVR